MSLNLKQNAWLLVAVAALGYFVDVFDILLVSVVRTASLRELGVPETDLLNAGITLINSQMLGMLVGGLLWGIYGDRRGRLKVLFGSILLYSVANVANAYVQDVMTYSILRFVAGVGLAGELGAGITLVAETLPKEKRGIGTMIVSTVGVAGGLCAAVLTKHWDWRTAYLIAGGMGLALLALRVSVHESDLYRSTAQLSDTRRGDLRVLFTRGRFGRFLRCILAGVPIYFVLGIFIAFAPEIGQAKGLGSTLTAGDAVFYGYIGFILGDLSSGLFSQLFRNRLKVVVAYLILTYFSCLALLMTDNLTLGQVHWLYLIIGIFAGYWAVLVTIAAEQFGTNLRSTVATSVPNLIRGAVVPLTLWAKAMIPSSGLVHSSLLVLTVVCVAGLIAAIGLRETFNTDLNYLEK